MFSLLSVIPLTKTLFEEAVLEYIACFSHKGIFTSAIGAFALGVGMTLSGAVSTILDTVTVLVSMFKLVIFYTMDMTTMYYCFTTILHIYFV